MLSGPAPRHWLSARAPQGRKEGDLAGAGSLTGDAPPPWSVCTAGPEPSVHAWGAKWGEWKKLFCFHFATVSFSAHQNTEYFRIMHLFLLYFV